MVSPGNIIYSDSVKKKPVSSCKRPDTVLSDDIGEVSTYTAYGESSHTDTLNPNDWIDEQSRDEDVYRVVQILKKRFSPQGRKCEEGIYRGAGVLTDF